MYKIDNDDREFWLRGPVPDIALPLQPAAHALLQAQKEINKAAASLAASALWIKPQGQASAGFHLQHIRGVLERLFAYADEQPLTADQLAELKQEGMPYAGNETVHQLLDLLNQRFALTLDYLKQFDVDTLYNQAFVGRAKVPTTKAGLIFHAAEHTMRHTGQLLVTVSVLLRQ